MNFDAVFKKPDVDWTKVKLANNSPCIKCKHRIDLRKQHPGNTWDPPLECTGCKERAEWVIRCLQKLEWYEKQEKEK